MDLGLGTTYQEVESGHGSLVTFQGWAVQNRLSMTTVAEAGDCFFKPHFLCLFNGGVALPGPDV